MSWHFSQALVAAYSEESCSDGEPSAPLKSSLIESPGSCNGKTKDSLNPSRYGMTCEPSTESPGEELLTWFLVDFLARTYLQPEPAPALRESDLGSGVRWHELSAKFDRPTSSWKTHRSLWVEVLQWSSVILPKWGMMQDGVLWERITPVPITSVIEYGYLPTPLASDGKHGGPNQRDSSGRLGLQAAAVTWATPCRADAKGSTGGGQGRSLRTDVSMWPTPTVSDATGGRTTSKGKKYPTSLNGAVRGLNPKFPTPKKRDWRTGDKPEARRAIAKREGKWPSPDLNDVAAPGGQLNPDWVEWLMGWPIGWTASAQLETARFQEWLQWHGEF